VESPRVIPQVDPVESRLSGLGELLREHLRRAGWRIVNRTPLPVVCFSHPRLEEGKPSIRELVEELGRYLEAR
jgi:hypothetical protein